MSSDSRVASRVIGSELKVHVDEQLANNKLQFDKMALDDYHRNQDNDVRLVDFLDDKLQSFADLDTLDSLLDSVKAQQDLLKQQVRESTSRSCSCHLLTIRIAS